MGAEPQRDRFGGEALQLNTFAHLTVIVPAVSRMNVLKAVRESQPATFVDANSHLPASAPVRGYEYTSVFFDQC